MVKVKAKVKTKIKSRLDDWAKRATAGATNAALST